MGIYQTDINQEVTDVKSVSYMDRDEQLELPFPPLAQVNPKERVESPREKMLREKQEQEELFRQFRTVLQGRDVAIEHKQQVFITVLNNFKTGNPAISNLSRSFLLEFLLRGL